MLWFFCPLQGNNLLNRFSSDPAFVEQTTKVLTWFPAAACSVWFFMLYWGEIHIAKPVLCCAVSCFGTSCLGSSPQQASSWRLTQLFKDVLTFLSIWEYQGLPCHSQRSHSLTLSNHFNLCFAPSLVTRRWKKYFPFPDKCFSPLQMVRFLWQRVDHVLIQNQAQIALRFKSLWSLGKNHSLRRWILFA